MPDPPRHDKHGCLVRWSGRLAVVALPERVAHSNVGLVGSKLVEVIAGGATVLIADLTATRSCDRGLADVLTWVYHSAQEHGTEVRLVIAGPVVRRMVARSGLDQVVPVFSSIEDAEASQSAPGVVLSMPPRAAASGSAPLAPGGPRPVTHLPVTSLAADDELLPAAEQRTPPRVDREADDRLSRIAGTLFLAGLALQMALDKRPDDLRGASERALGLLDEAIREARDATFAGYADAPDGSASSAEDGPVRVDSATGAQSAGRAAASAAEREALLARSESTRTRSREVRARTLRVAAFSVATGERVAATLGQLAGSHPRHSVSLLELSQAAASHATRTREWANDHTAS